MNEIDKTKSDLLNAIIDAERAKATSIITNWAEKNNYNQAFIDILEPVLKQIGELWYKNKLSLAQGYLTGKVAEDVFLLASKKEEFIRNKQNKGNVVIGNIEDDFHSLGRKLLGIFLSSAGWNVHDLGNDVMPEEFINKARKTNSRIIGVSAMMYTTAKNISKIRSELDKQDLSGYIQLAVGGAVFRLREKLVEEVGGDGTTDNALNAPILFDALWNKSINYEQRKKRN